MEAVWHENCNTGKDNEMRKKRETVMIATIFIALCILWVIGVFAFHFARMFLSPFDTRKKSSTGFEGKIDFGGRF